MTAGAWTELIASGLITGGIYALVALGLNLQYGLMRIMNIAHGEFLMLGAFLTWMAHTVARAVAAADGAGGLRAAHGAGLAIHRVVLPPPGAHVAQRGRVRGAQPDGQLRADVHRAEPGPARLGRRPARLRLPGTQPVAVRRRAVHGQQAGAARARARVQHRAHRRAAHHAARQGGARADAVAHRRAAGGHRHAAAASADVRHRARACRAWRARCCR